MKIKKKNNMKLNELEMHDVSSYDLFLSSFFLVWIPGSGLGVFLCCFSVFCLLSGVVNFWTDSPMRPYFAVRCLLMKTGVVFTATRHTHMPRYIFYVCCFGVRVCMCMRVFVVLCFFFSSFKIPWLHFYVFTYVVGVPCVTKNGREKERDREEWGDETT